MPFIATPLQNYANLDLSQLPYLQGPELAHPFSLESDFPVSMLVGVDYYWNIVGDQVIRGTGPTAVESKLGYLLSGPTQQGYSHSMATNVSMILTPALGEFNLERFWTLESIRISQTEDTVEANLTENYVSSCVTQADDGAYIARFPWKIHHPPLPTNFTVAKHRTQQLVKRLATKPKLLQLYNQN